MPATPQANIANPNTSEESKEHSRQVIQDLEQGNVGTECVCSPLCAHAVSYHPTIRHVTDEPGKDVNRVIGGLKATLHSG